MGGIILDIDKADLSLRRQLVRYGPMQGFWGVKLGDEIIDCGLTTATSPFVNRHHVFVDLKHYDVRDRLARIVRKYARGAEYAPKFLTISGARPVEAIAAAVAERGPIDIIVTGPLSDDHLADEEDVAETLDKVYESGAQGITCPAWLLPESPLKTYDGHVVTTGVVSKGVARRHHFNPRPLEFALDYGATHVVVGTEVTESDDPFKTLLGLVARWHKHNLTPAH